MFVNDKIYTLCSKTDLIILRGQKSHVKKFLCDIYIFSQNFANRSLTGTLPGTLILSKTSPWFLCVYKAFENTGGNGEIACNEQFLLFTHCFLPVRKTFGHFH